MYARTNDGKFPHSQSLICFDWFLEKRRKNYILDMAGLLNLQCFRLYLAILIAPQFLHIVLASISDEDMGLTEDTFRIIGRIGETAPERYSIGTNIYFEINLTPTIALEDEVSIQLTSFINGYSSVVFCGDPAFDSLSPVQSWEVFALDQISPYVSFCST